MTNSVMTGQPWFHEVIQNFYFCSIFYSAIYTAPMEEYHYNNVLSIYKLTSVHTSEMAKAQSTKAALV